MKEVSTSSSSLWATQACIDASTKVSHTENDCTYTIISVPEQVKFIRKKASRKVNFLFSPNAANSLEIPLKNNFEFFYSALCLTHRQSFPVDASKEGNFVNVSSYGNERLYNHIRTSFNRVKKNN